MPLPLHAEALLADVAREHGLGSLRFDADGLIPINLGDFDFALAFCERRDSFFVMASLEPGAACGAAVRLIKEAEDLGPSRAQFLRMVEPETGAHLLLAERPAGDLRYPQFLALLEDFVRAVQQTRAGGPPTGTVDLPRDVFSWIRS